MPFSRYEHAARLLGIDEDGGDLLGIAETQMLPGLAGIHGFIDTIAGRKVRTLQSFAAANIKDVRIRGSNRDDAHRTRILIVKNRKPGVPKIRSFPNSPIYRSHVKNVGLMRHASYAHGASTAERPDQTPSHIREKFLVVLLRASRRREETPHQAAP